MQKLIVSLKLSRYCPRLCFEPQRRAASPSSPSRTTPAMMSTEASSQRPSITYVIARKPTRAFTTVITSAGEALRTQSIGDLRDRGRPRPHAVPRRNGEAASRREDEVDPRPEPDEPDALALLDLIPGPEVRDDAAREDPRDLAQPQGAEVRVELPLEPFVRGALRARGDRVAPGGVLQVADNPRHRGAVHVDVGDSHENRDAASAGVRGEDPSVRGGDDARRDVPAGVPKEEQEGEEREAEGDREEAQDHPLEHEHRRGDPHHDDDGREEDGDRSSAGNHGPRNCGGR